MSAPFANEQLSAYLDGELTDAEVSELEALLESDPSLRSELAALEGAIASLRSHAPAFAPEGFKDSVLAKLEHEPIPANNVAFWRRPFGVPLEGVAIAAVALMVFGVALNLGVAPDPEPTNAAIAKLDLGPQELPGKASAPTPAATRADEATRQQAAAAAPEPQPRLKKQQVAAKPSSSGSKSLIQELIGDVSETQAVAGTEASGEYTAPEASVDSTSGGTDKQSAKVAGYRYVLTTDNPDVAAALNRLAARYKGKLEDSSGKSVQGDMMASSDTASLRVHLPASALREFGDDLRSLGSVQQENDNRWYTGDQVQVQIDVQMARPVQYRSAPTSSPPATTPSTTQKR